jgi:lipoprotein-releasing system permease protein
MNTSLRIAVRYIFSFKSFHFITVISLLSVIGIIIGVAALICVASIFNGFREFTEEQLVAFDPHIRITAKEGAWIQNADSISLELLQIDNIRKALPTIQGRVVALNKKNLQPIVLNGVDPERIDEVVGVKNTIVYGRFNLDKTIGLPGVVIGAGVADRLRANPGDTISLFSPEVIEKSFKYMSIPRASKGIVTGIFQSNASNYDDTYLYISEAYSRKLFKSKSGDYHNIDIRLKTNEKIDETVAQIKSILPEELELLTWYDLHRELYSIMQFERWASFVVISLIVVIAAFNILASLWMTVIEKRPDIGILKSMGADRKMIRNVFLYEGIIIGLMSSVIGVTLGLLLCYIQIEFKVFTFGNGNVVISALPVSVNTLDVVLAGVIACILSILATIAPATRASKVIVSQALREE